MASNRAAKQVVYGALYLVIFFGVISGIYFGILRSPASCFDGIQNQSETGVDCGGPCEPCEIRELAPLRVGLARIFSANGGATIFVEVRNPNVTFGATSFDYTLTAKNAAGQTVRTFSGKSFIYPGEIKYFVEPLLNTAPDGVRSAELTIAADSLAWKRREEFQVPLMQFREIRHELREDGTIATSGLVINGETVPFQRLIVGAIYSDPTGFVLGASKTELRDVRAFEERFFQIVHPALPGADLRETRLFFEGKRP